MGEAAYFLQVTWSRAELMYDRGKLPRALRADGGPFAPVPHRILVPALALRALLEPAGRAECDAWRGEISPRPGAALTPRDSACELEHRDALRARGAPACFLLRLGLA